MLQWLYHFNQYSTQRQAGAWRLLILDGYGLHCTLEFITYCDQHRIVPLCFPPHATHLMQPLDVVVFEPYKHHHSEAVDQERAPDVPTSVRQSFCTPSAPSGIKLSRPRLYAPRFVGQD